MSWAAELTAIEARFAAAWGATTRVAYGNVPFTPQTDESWVRLSVQSGDAERITIGQALHRHLGIIFIQIFTPVGRGEKPGRALADTASAVFRDAYFSTILCKSARMTVVGAVGSHHQINISIPFERDEIF